MEILFLIIHFDNLFKKNIFVDIVLYTFGHERCTLDIMLLVFES